MVRRGEMLDFDSDMSLTQHISKSDHILHFLAFYSHLYHFGKKTVLTLYHFSCFRLLLIFYLLLLILTRGFQIMNAQSFFEDPKI